MQNERIFAAPSLVEVIKQLLIYRPTGMLTLWRAIGPRQEDAKITIECGHPLHVFRGSHREQANESILTWLNSWGELHFSFVPTETPSSLPASAQISGPQQPMQTEPPMKPVLPRRRSAVTQPLQALTLTTRPANTPTTKVGQQPHMPLQGKVERTYELSTTQASYRSEEQSNGNAQSNHLPAIAHQTVIASVTTSGKDYPIANLPRYDRTIFLLINGRRSVVDLSQLTKRSLEEVYATLYRLQNMQLITVEAWS